MASPSARKRAVRPIRPRRSCPRRDRYSPRAAHRTRNPPAERRRRCRPSIDASGEGGGEISAVECNFSQGNFQPQILIEQIISQNANALLLVPSITQRSQAIAIAQANQQRLPLLGNHSLYTFETIQQGKDAVAGMIVPSPWLPNTTPNNNFSATSMKYWGGKVNWRTAMAYDATASIIQGVQHSSTHTRSELHSILTQSNFVIHGASGRFRFEHGDRHGKVQLASIQQSINNPGELKFSYIQLKD